MATRKKPIPLPAPDDSLLRTVYVQFRIPRDQFKKRPEDLATFAAVFNQLSGRHEEAVDLLHYIQTRQKAAGRLPVPWPTFDGNHQRAPALTHTLDEDKLQVLREAYEKIVLPHRIGTDSVLWNVDIMKSLAAEFSRRTGQVVPGVTLLAIAEERRKRGEWFKVGRGRHEGSGEGFGDLDAAAGM
ncbi:MAG TPA: hypothetical protein VHY91_25820 [Pirellulales bacterium]|jgi:hypothetical protein|nr:hypothetical protein [Pirellulales bacterium]